jgi:hypothetical protein
VKPFLYWTVAAVLCVCLGHTTVSAQNVARPYPAVFGGAGTSAPTKGPTLDVALEAANAYDDNLQADVAGLPSVVPVQRSGFYTMLAPSVMLDAQAGGAHIGATASSNLRYYGDLRKVVVTGQAVAIGINAALNRQTSVFVNQGVTYAPAYLHGLFATVGTPVPGTPIEPASDYDVDSQRSFVYATTARLTRVVTPRFSLSADAGYRRTDFSGNTPGYFDLRGYDVGGAMRYSMSRNLKLRLGYNYQFTQYAPGYHPEENNVEIGLEYSRALSGLRRTTFAFSLGPSTASGVVPSVESSENRRQVRVAGNFAVNHQLSRTWNLLGSVRRGLGYIENLPRPVLSNAASVTAQGFLNRRTDLTVSAAYTTGEMALAGTPPPFSTYTGVARLRFAFARHLAVYGEYLYYYYEFNRDFPLPPGVASTLTRNGARAGVTLWVPVTKEHRAAR